MSITTKLGTGIMVAGLVALIGGMGCGSKKIRSKKYFIGGVEFTKEEYLNIITPSEPTNKSPEEKPKTNPEKNSEAEKLPAPISSIDATITEVQSENFSSEGATCNLKYVFARDSFENYLFTGCVDGPILRSAVKIWYREFENNPAENIIKKRVAHLSNTQKINVKGIFTNIQYNF